MYLKLILCHVAAENRIEFQKRQAVWKEIENQEGLVFQIGGWNERNPSISCKLALWQNQHLYQQFHQNAHDEMVKKANHSHLYYKIEIDFFHPQIPMPGKYNNLQEKLLHTQFLRVADCVIFPNEKERFISAQKNVWIPEMNRSTGMLGGYFSQAEKEENRFLVSTFWESKKEHFEYQQTKVKDLREKANVTETIKTINSHFVSIIPEWSAIGEAGKSISI